MGESNQITLTSNGPSGPEAPNAPDMATSSVSPGVVQVSTNQPEAPEAPVDATIPQEPSEAAESGEALERPEWLDSKFNSAEELQRAYNELQSKLGEAPAAEEATPAEEAGISTEALAPFAEEYYAQGTLSENSFSKLEGMGLSRDLVTAFMEGQQAVQAAELQKIYAQAGGQDAYQQALVWAAASMSPEEIAAYNDQVESGDINTASVAVRGLMAMYSQGSPTANNPTLMKSEPAGPGGASAYDSVAQLVADMQKPEYKTDPAFRAKVAQRLERTNVL